ncbi:MAG: hypothetical protein K8W52_14735 [Deltaproteobacteria bacterium]|nr:hypothetical protein [Deltaproteobacteria bacterium]
MRARWWLAVATYAIAAMFAVVLVPGSWRWSALAIAVGAPLLWRWWLHRAMARHGVAAVALNSALRTGNFALAEREAVALRRAFPRPRHVDRYAGYQLAQLVLRQGRLADAIEILSEIDRQGGVFGHDWSIAARLSLFHGLRGDLEPAERWFVEAQARAATFVPWRFNLALAEVVIDLRRDKFDDVVTYFARHWPEMERTLTGEALRPLRLLRAFALASVNGARGAGAASMHLDALRPARVEEFACLATEWPALDAFIRTSLPS